MSPPGKASRARPVTAPELGIGILFDAVRDAAVVSDATGTIQLWNDGAEDMFGWTREEAVGRNVAMLVPEAYRAQHHAGMTRFAATGHGTLIDTDRTIELPALRKDGTVITVELSLAPLERGKHRYALALVRDVTERVRLRKDLERRGADLERSVHELSHLNESLTAFTYVVSHDLKEPVRAIDTYLRILKEDHGDQLSADAAEVLDRALASTDRLAALLRGLLDLSRMDREPLHPQRVTLRAVIESDPCRAAYEGLVRERGAVLELEGGATEALAAPSILCQVLANLVTNAVRHNPSPHPRVRVRARPIEAGRIEVSVEDNGPGFTARLLEQAEDENRRESLRGGFGLLIARRAVARLGGSMRLGASADLGGAAARFTVPAAP